MGRSRYPLTECPVCREQVKAAWSTGKLWRHGARDRQCPGTGAVVDLYGPGVKA